MIFKEKIVTRLDDYDSKGRMLPSRMLQAFENVGDHHTQKVKDINNNGEAWILVGWRVQILSYPKKGEASFVNTWAIKYKGGLFTHRAFIIKDKKGNVLVKAVADLALFDIIHNKTCKIESSKIAKYKPIDDEVFKDETPRFVLPSSFQKEVNDIIRPSDLDFLGHVHNTKYVDLFMDFRQSDATIKEFIVSYRSPIKAGMDISFKSSLTDDEEIIVALNEGKTHSYIIFKY